MPGPQAALEWVVATCEEGRSVVLVIPESLGSGWARRIRTHAGRRLTFDELPSDLGRASDPLRALSQVCLPDEELGCLPTTARDLLQHKELRGRRLLLEMRVSAGWLGWQRLLSDWAAAAQGMSDAFERPSVTVVVAGVPEGALPPADAMLAVRPWQAVAEHADLLLYATLAFAERGLRPFQRRLAASVAAHAAVFDPEVIDRLVDEPLTRVLAPSPVLNAMAKDRGWFATDLKSGDYPWCLGQSDVVDGRLEVHSAVWAALGRHDEVDRRVWTGQVGILLPFVEERRRELLQEIRAAWPVVSDLPDGKGGYVRDLYELEIGHLYSIRGTLRRRLREEFVGCLGPLRDIRNRLAHLETIPHDLLESPPIKRIEHGLLIDGGDPRRR